MEIPQVNGVADTIIAACTRAESIANTVTTVPEQARKREHRFDRFVLGKYTGIPLLLLLFLVLLWITIIGANYPSALLQSGFAHLRTILDSWLAGAPDWVQGLLLDGMYQVLTWVCGYAAANGNFLSAVYIIGGLGLSTTSCLPT